MRNSFLPVMLMLAVMGFSLYLLPRGSGRGTGGPEINAGIFRFPKKAIHQVDSMPLEQENRVVTSAGASAAATVDLRQVSVVSGGDHAESTRAVMYAMAEEITRLGGVAILDPMRAPESDTSLVLPIGAAQVFRVSTEAEKLP
nr:hypothetical protein [Planctomycetota bacterium]